MRKIISISLFLFLFIACDQTKKPISVTDEEGNTISYFDGSDKAMNEAIENARNTFSEFKDAFGNRQDKYHHFSIKMALTTPTGGKEHIWVGDLNFDGKEFSGVLLNKPVDATNYHQGDTLTVKEDKVSDWIFLEGETNKVRGAYTMKVYRNTLTDEERKQFDEESGYNFDE